MKYPYGKEGPKTKKKEYDPVEELKVLIDKEMPFDKYTKARDVIRKAAKRAGISPALLGGSAYIEGMNKAISTPGKWSTAYDETMPQEARTEYPIDGFFNYGLDRFGELAPEFIKRGYLPADFKYHPFDGVNEKAETVKTAAFRNNEDALVAKAAFLRYNRDQINEYAKQKGIDLDEDAATYFTMANYNAGTSNAQMMMDQYLTAKDKVAFIRDGLTTRKAVHKNIAPRLSTMKALKELYDQEDAKIQNPLASNTPAITQSR
jgi:hypothetical protein